MSQRPYRRFSKEFKLEAVRLAKGSDQSLTQVARELGIRVNQIYKWHKEFDAKQGDAFRGKGRQAGRATPTSAVHCGLHRQQRTAPISPSEARAAT